MHCCICQLNHWNANAKKSQIIKPHRAWQWKLFSLWGVADDDLTTLFDFPLSALILQQTVFEAGPTKLKMEKASLLFHLFVEKISWRFCILSPQKLILINSWKILKRLLRYFISKKKIFCTKLEGELIEVDKICLQCTKWFIGHIYSKVGTVVGSPFPYI